MNQIKPGREVMVVGVGLHPFGRFPDKDLGELAIEAVVPALKDAGVRWKDIAIAYFGHVYYQGMSVGETTLSKLGLTGVPIVNVENACSSGSTAFWQAYWGITTGLYEMALAFGAEKVPRGPVTVTPEDSPERYIGGDHMMAGYALRSRRYMEETGAPASALAQVSVKARQNGALNPFAHRKDTYTVEEVLNSRMIADPLTLFQCCPTSEGGAAAVLCARESLAHYGIDEGRAVSIAAAVLTSGDYNGRGADHSAFSPYRTEPAALQAYEMSGLGPEDVDLVQVHDAATIGELQQIEALHLFPFGEAWQGTVEGRTALTGDIPVNTDGGLLAMGHPFGASGIRMIHETVT
ncbi:MAG: thiolase family protein, partial [Chloroflexi bacterium]|nr:thiolase family protein [Chloroflexota bacterium]